MKNIPPIFKREVISALYNHQRIRVMQNIEIEKVLYDLFNRFELEDISYLNRVSRHIEHSELT